MDDEYDFEKDMKIKSIPAARLRLIMFSQSAMCLLSSSLDLGGRYVGLVLLITFSRVLGPTIDCVGLCLGLLSCGVLCTSIGEVGGSFGGGIEKDMLDEDAGAEWGGVRD